MRQRLHDLVREKSGQALLIFALASPIALGAAGMAVDVSMWIRQKDGLQAAADAAALGASSELNKSGTTSDRLANAQKVAKGLIAVNANGSARTVTVKIDDQAGEAEVDASEPAQINFAKLFGIQPFDLNVRSVARLKGEKRRDCIIALDKTAKTGVSISGSGSFIAQDCAVVSDSGMPQSIAIGGSVKVDVKSICGVGGWVVNGNAASVNPKPRYCKYTKDPLAGKDLTPIQTSCKMANKVVNSKTSVALTPGRYCNGVTISSDGDITLAPGEYIVDNGPLKLTAQGSITGTNVGVFLRGKLATLDVNGQARVILQAAAPGLIANQKMPGVVLASDPSQTGNLSTKITGGAMVELKGTVHLPNQDFVWRGNSRTSDPTEITQIIAKTVDIAGTTKIYYAAKFEKDNFQPIVSTDQVSYLAR